MISRRCQVPLVNRHHSTEAFPRLWGEYAYVCFDFLNSISDVSFSQTLCISMKAQIQHCIYSEKSMWFWHNFAKRAAAPIYIYQTPKIFGRWCQHECQICVCIDDDYVLSIDNAFQYFNSIPPIIAFVCFLTFWYASFAYAIVAGAGNAHVIY